MDPIDLALLRLLQADNRRAAAELGEAVGLSVSAAGERVRRLNATGVIRANRALPDPARLGFDICAFIFVDLAPQADEAGFAAALAAMPEVQEAHHVTGPHSWLLKLRVRDTASLQRAIATRLKPLPGVLRTETLIALDTAKETAELDLGA
jgi:Lrp/AsnC family leucine-responsive transcriptional regulator